MDDQDQIHNYLSLAALHKEGGNEFGHGLFIGRALEHADQNAVDPDWLRETMDEYGLDSALVAVPKMEVPRG